MDFFNSVTQVSLTYKATIPTSTGFAQLIINQESQSENGENPFNGISFYDVGDLILVTIPSENGESFTAIYKIVRFLENNELELEPLPARRPKNVQLIEKPRSFHLETPDCFGEIGISV